MSAPDSLPIPHDIEAEQCVLGCMLLSSDALMTALQVLDEACFYREAHRTIFDAMRRMAERGTVCDIITVPSELSQAGVLEEAGGASYVMVLADQPASTKAIDAYCEAVKSCYVRRRLMSVGRDCISLAAESGLSAEEALSAAEGKVYAIGDKRASGALVPLSKTIHQTVIDVGKLKRREGGIDAIPSGIRALDSMSGGWQLGSLNIIAARPSMGKTAFATFCARHAAKLGYGVAFFSLEMKRKQLEHNLLALESGVNSRLIRQATLTDADEALIGEASCSMQDWPLLIDDSSRVRPLDVVFRVRRMAHTTPIALVFIDYLQLMQPPVPKHGEVYDCEKAKVASTVQALKQHCKDLPNVAVVALAQMNRLGEGVRPELRHLAESGKIEADADLVYMQWIEEGREAGVECEVEGILAKQRVGPTGSFKMNYDKAIGEFRGGC